MDRTSAGLLAGWALVLASPVLGLGNLYAQWQSCRLDWPLSNAPLDAGGWSTEPRPMSLGCDTVYRLLDGSTLVLPPPIDLSLTLVSAFAAGVALVVVCVRARRTPQPTVVIA